MECKMTLKDLIDLNEYFSTLGHAIQYGIVNVANGARLEDQHKDSLPHIETFFKKASDFIADPNEAMDLADNIQMFLFGADLPYP